MKDRDELEFEPGLFSLDPAKPPPTGTPALAPTPPTASSTPSPAGGIENQRKHLRFRVEGVVPKVYAKGLLSSIGLGRASVAHAAVNLSEGGMLVAGREKIKPGTAVHFRLEFEKFKDAIEAEGEVCWCRASAKDEGVFYIGIRFPKLDPAQARKIAAMRDWFTSPEYKLRSATRRRSAGPQLEITG